MSDHVWLPSLSDHLAEGSLALWVGGDFTVIDGRATSRIARAQ